MVGTGILEIPFYRLLPFPPFVKILESSSFHEPHAASSASWARNGPRVLNTCQDNRSARNTGFNCEHPPFGHKPLANPFACQGYIYHHAKSRRRKGIVYLWCERDLVLERACRNDPIEFVDRRLWFGWLANS